MTKHNFKVRVLLYQDSNFWVTQGLEYDIATQGTTIQLALDSFERVFLGQISLDINNGLEPLQNTEPAPKEWFETFESTQQRMVFDTQKEPVEPSFEDIRILA